MSLIHFKDVPVGSCFVIVDEDGEESPYIYRKVDTDHIHNCYNISLNYLSLPVERFIGRCKLLYGTITISMDLFSGRGTVSMETKIIVSPCKNR